MSFHGLELLTPNKYEIDFLNEVQNVDFGQGAAKILKVKVGGRKKNCQLSPVRTDAKGRPSWLTFDIFAAP